MDPDDRLAAHLFRKAFAKLLREEVKARGLSIGRFARRVDVDYQTAHNWLKGETTPQLHNLLAICALLDWPPPYPGAEELIERIRARR